MQQGCFLMLRQKNKGECEGSFPLAVHVTNRLMMSSATMHSNNSWKLLLPLVFASALFIPFAFTPRFSETLDFTSLFSSVLLGLRFGQYHFFALGFIFFSGLLLETSSNSAIAV